MRISNSWSGTNVDQARAYMARYLPTQCARCGREVGVGDAWVVGHIKSRAAHPELTMVPSNWQIEHRTCSDASAQRAVQERAHRSALRSVGLDVDLGQEAPFFPTDGRPESPRPSASPSLSPSEVREDLQWPTHAHGASAWLQELLAVPSDSSPPLAMTPVHAEAVGSYGPEAADFIERAFRVRLRWWQRLVLYRMLEHREDGTLCWREVLLSASRRSGKSLLLRGLAVWRMTNADQFGEAQTILHVASDVAIAREVQRFTWRYAEGVGWKISKANGKEQIETPEGDRWLVRAQGATTGYDGTLVLGDEMWDVPPTVVDDNLEPAMLDRIDPQMLLTSTAHPRARSTMPGRIATALAADDDTTLLLLWAAPWGCDVGDPAMWRAASPHWSEDRRRRLEANYAKALAGETSREFDNLDPLAAFRSQYLNQWNLNPSRRQVGDRVATEETWSELVQDRPHKVPSRAAIESWYDQGVSLALAWTVDGQTVVSVTDHPDLSSAADALTSTGYRGVTVVGASLMEDPALRGIRKKAGQGRSPQAVADLIRLIAEDAVRHDGGEHLSDQVLEVRTTPGTDGPRLVSKGRLDAIKAAVWAVQSARTTQSLGKPRILLPTA